MKKPSKRGFSRGAKQGRTDSPQREVSSESDDVFDFDSNDEQSPGWTVLSFRSLNSAIDWFSKNYTVLPDDGPYYASFTEPFLTMFPSFTKGALLPEVEKLGAEILEMVCTMLTEEVSTGLEGILKNEKVVPRKIALKQKLETHLIASLRTLLAKEDDSYTRLCDSILKAILKVPLRSTSPESISSYLQNVYERVEGIAHEEYTRCQRTFSTFPVRHETDPHRESSVQELAKKEILSGFLNTKLKIIESLPKECFDLEPHLIRVLKLRGKKPRDFFACKDDRVREKWLSEARAALKESLDRGASEPAGGEEAFQMAPFLRCPQSKWIKLMRVLGFAFDSQSNKYLWPTGRPFWQACYLVERIKNYRGGAIFQSDHLFSRSAIFFSLFTGLSVTFTDVKKLEKALTRPSNNPMDKSSTTKAELDKAFEEVFGH